MGVQNKGAGLDDLKRSLLTLTLGPEQQASLLRLLGATGGPSWLRNSVPVSGSAWSQNICALQHTVPLHQWVH